MGDVPVYREKPSPVRPASPAQPRVSAAALGLEEAPAGSSSPARGPSHPEQETWGGLTSSPWPLPGVGTGQLDSGGPATLGWLLLLHWAEGPEPAPLSVE